MTVLVTGGTGKTGRHVVSALQSSGHSVRTASRSVSGPESVRFDWADPSTHADAAQGVGAAYLVAPADRFDLLPAMRPFIDRLLAQGAPRLVLLSAASLPIGGPLMGQVHAYLADHAPRWTVLRPSWFMQNFSEQQHRATIVEEDAIYSATGDGKVGWIDARDIAAVAATVLVDADRDNGDLVLTGPEVLGYDEIAETIGSTVGRVIAHHRLTVDQLSSRFIAAGFPEDYARTLAGMDGEIAKGEAAFTTDAVRGTTGADGRSFETFARGNVEAWRQSRPDPGSP